MDKSWDKLGSLVFVWQPFLEKKNSEFKPAILYLKLGLMSHPACGIEIG